MGNSKTKIMTMGNSPRENLQISAQPYGESSVNTSPSTKMPDIPPILTSMASLSSFINGRGQIRRMPKSLRYTYISSFVNIMNKLVIYLWCYFRIYQQGMIKTKMLRSGQDVELGYESTVLSSQPRLSVRPGWQLFLQTPNNLYSVLVCFIRVVTEALCTISNTHIKIYYHN